MEAEAKHDFTQTADDELGFKKKDVLKILNQTDDANWYKAELDGREGYVPKNYIDMQRPAWFVNQGVVSRSEAETLLLKKERGECVHPDGAFLVRNSESSPGDFSLSVKYGDGVQHFKILHDGSGKYFLWIVKFKSINALVHHHRKASVSRSQTIFLTDMASAGSPTPAAPSKDGFYVRGLYDFEPHEDSELGFLKGDVIEIVDQTDVNWWTGKLNGKVGQIPKTYVTKINKHDGH